MTGGILFGRFTTQMFRNTLCNNLDTMNNKLLRTGKPRIHVQSIDSREKIKHDLNGKPMNESDTDAMLTLFFQMAGDSRVIFLGNISSLENNAEAQRCMKKAAQHEVRVLEDSLKKNDAKHACQYVELGNKKDDEITALKHEIAELKVLLSKKEEEVCAIGSKRARTEPDCSIESGILEKLFQRLDDKDIMAKEREAMAKEREAMAKEREEAKTQFKKANNEINSLKEELRKVRSIRDKAEEQIKSLLADNEKKVKKNEKLCKTARQTATTMGYGTRAWALFFETDLTTTAGIAAAEDLKKSLRNTVIKVHRQKYLVLKNMQGMKPFGQTDLRAYLGYAEVHDSGDDGWECAEDK